MGERLRSFMEVVVLIQMAEQMSARGHHPQLLPEQDFAEVGG
jgi:hypothetical protein